MSRREHEAAPDLDEVTAWGADPYDDLAELYFHGGTTALPSIFDLSGRVAVVTGAGGGLGAVFATVLAEAGAAVVCADMDAVAAKRLAEFLRSRGMIATDVGLDVTDEPAVEAAFAAVSRDLGRLDVLVNNAGIGDPRSVPLHRVRTEDWRRVLDVDLDGVFLCSRAALRTMVDKGSGKIVNVASMFGLTGARVSPIPAYSAAKGAVVNLTRELGLQYAAKGIQVNALCPGFVRTGLSGGVYEDRDFLARVSATVPMGRIAEPAELRGALLMLASSASDYMTGQTLVVDGGCTAG
ncbi:SDR family NAD(P)-dependent oxidoreductase [Pseudonocardia sp. RS010]|uniref:SDR family NAD(P)-dependent oxidoreductase n=1 Tax=Pseudonocardia sp. RS010 TaxID=3385979 RepID=UPI0039A27CAA